MLFRETVAVYCENHTEHINTLCGQNAVLVCKVGCTYSNHWALKGSSQYEGVGAIGNLFNCTMTRHMTET
jgi:hypothetical protein